LDACEPQNKRPSGGQWPSNLVVKSLKNNWTPQSCNQISIFPHNIFPMPLSWAKRAAD